MADNYDAAHEDDDTRSYSCPECGKDDRWMIQNRIAPAAAYFNPKITHVECANCRHVAEAETKEVDH